MFPVLCVDDAPRERGRPARTMPRHSLGHLRHSDRPAAAPWLSFGLAVVVTADVVAACKAARKLSDHHKQQHAGGTPALPGNHSPLGGESQKPSRQAKADAVGGGRRAARLRRTATSGPFSTVRIS